MRKVLFLSFACAGLAACGQQYTQQDFARIKEFGPNNFAEREWYDNASGRTAFFAERERKRQSCQTINDRDLHYQCINDWMTMKEPAPEPGPTAGYGNIDRDMAAGNAGEARDIIHSIHNHMN